MQTFKEYLITENEIENPNDVSMHGDDELINWVINDEYLYNIAGSVGSFDELMATIDASFTYNNDQYNALARAYRMGDLRDEQQEEEEAKVPAMRDTQKMSRNYPDESGKRSPSIKRQGQRASRRLRRMHGKGNPAKNAEGFLDSIYRR